MINKQRIHFLSGTNATAVSESVLAVAAIQKTLNDAYQVVSRRNETFGQATQATPAEKLLFHVISKQKSEVDISADFMHLVAFAIPELAEAQSVYEKSFRKERTGLDRQSKNTFLEGKKLAEQWFNSVFSVEGIPTQRHYAEKYFQEFNQYDVSDLHRDSIGCPVTAFSRSLESSARSGMSGKMQHFMEFLMQRLNMQLAPMVRGEALSFSTESARYNPDSSLFTPGSADYKPHYCLNDRRLRDEANEFIASFLNRQTGTRSH